MVYGKIVDNKIIFASENLVNLKVGDKFIWGTVNKESLLNLGFKELSPTKKPKQKKGFIYHYTWEIVDNKITCIWHETEIVDEQLS